MAGVTPITDLSGDGMSECPFFIRIEVTIVLHPHRSRRRTLGLQSLEWHINVGLAPSVAYVIQQVAGSEVIASVYHYIVVPYQFSGILLVQTEGVYFHVYIAVQTLHSTGSQT